MRGRARRHPRSGMEYRWILAVQVASDRKAEKLARADAVEAVPGDARGVFGGSAEGWLSHSFVSKPAHAVLNTAADEGLRPLDPLQVRAPEGLAGHRRSPCRAKMPAMVAPWSLSASLCGARFRLGRGRCGHPPAHGGGCGLPARDCWNGSDPEAAGGGCAHPHPPRCPHRASKPTGRSHPRPDGPDRHRRFGGRGATSGLPATCNTGEVRIARADSVHIDPDVSCTPLVRHLGLDSCRSPPPGLRAERSSGRR